MLIMEGCEFNLSLFFFYPVAFDQGLMKQEGPHQILVP
jgi:hypothetical protein